MVKRYVYTFENFLSEIPEENRKELQQSISDDDNIFGVLHYIKEKNLDEELPLQPLRKYTLSRFSILRYASIFANSIRNYYEDNVPDRLKNDPEFLKDLCSEHPVLIRILLDKIVKIDGLIFRIIDENIKDVESVILGDQYPPFPAYINAYIGKKDPTFQPDDFCFAADKIEFLQKDCNSNLYDKLYKKYGKSFDEKYSDAYDKEFFMYKMLRSSALERIYSDPYYTVNDINCVSKFLDYIENPGYRLREKYPTMYIRKAMHENKKKYVKLALKQYNDFALNKNNEENLTKQVQELGIKKDGIFEYVKGQKYWSKQQKEFVATLLCSYFKTGDVLTIYDVIDLLEEMEERKLTKKEILEERNIDSKYFEKIYDVCKKNNPELFELMQEKFKNNKIRGFKKLLGLYRSLMNYKLSTEEDFMNKYKTTPLEALELFKNTKFYEDVYNKISPLCESGNKVSKKQKRLEEVANIIVSQMEANILSTDGELLVENKKNNSEIKSSVRGFTQISILVLFAFIMSIGIIILGILFE